MTSTRFFLLLCAAYLLADAAVIRWALWGAI